MGEIRQIVPRRHFVTQERLETTALRHVIWTGLRG